MNIYETKFTALCPNNGERIEYELCIKVHEPIPVESISSVCSSFERGYHEQFAESLKHTFGGLQTLRANHHGVWITTHRSGPAARFSFIEWGAA